jgi:hypothetical protein
MILDDGPGGRSLPYRRDGNTPAIDYFAIVATE